RERVGDVTVEALEVRRHEVRLRAARKAVQREEAIERRAALRVGGCPAERCLGRVLEAADLPAQLVPFLLSQTLHVRLDVARKGETRAGDEPRSHGAITAPA